MSVATEQEIEDVRDMAVSLESIQHDMGETLLEKGSVDYADVRRLREIETHLGIEGLEFQDIKDMFAAAGRVTVSMGQAFMRFLDMVHRMIDSTYLVTVAQMRNEIKAGDAGDGHYGKMERPRLGNALSIHGALPSNFNGPTQRLLDFSKRTSMNVIPDLASMARRIGARLDAKRSSGSDALNEDVEAIADIIGSYKTPMNRYPSADYTILAPGNRSIFEMVRPSRPRREPYGNGAVKKIVEGVTTTNYGITSKAEKVRGKGDPLVPILNREECLALLDQAELLLREAVRVKQSVKAYAKDKVPSTLSLVISGIYYGVKRTMGDFFYSQPEGPTTEFEGASGGQMNKHVTQRELRLTPTIRPGTMGFESRGDQEERRAELAPWVSRYLKLSLIDHHDTSRALIMLLVGVARSYIDYVEQSRTYHR